MGFLAAVAAMVLGWIPEGKFDLHHAFLLGASSVLTASFASFVLGQYPVVLCSFKHFRSQEKDHCCAIPFYAPATQGA